jgi:hypothetical protein
MPTYAEEAEATLNKIYSKHLEAHEGDIRVFKRQVF